MLYLILITYKIIFKSSIFNYNTKYDCIYTLQWCALYALKILDFCNGIIIFLRIILHFVRYRV